MIAEFIGPDDPRWSDTLRRTRHDYGQLPAYVALAAEHEGGEPCAFYAEAGGSVLLVPLLVRRLPEWLGAPGSWRDATSPYGYPSPILAGDPDELPRLMRAFRVAAADRDIISAFVRLHPLLPPSGDALESVGHRVEHGETVFIDLSRSRDEIDGEIKKGYRYDIRKLRRDGYRARFDDWDGFSRFVEIYHETMERVSASERYFFSPAYFSGFREALGERLHLCTVDAPDGEVAAAGLFTETCGLVQYHLSGTAAAHENRSPTKLMLDAAIDWARERGADVLHLGGGVGGAADSLFRFKARFSDGRARFSTLRIIADPDRCGGLDERWNDRARGLGVQPDPEFFPRYRQPLEE